MAFMCHVVLSVFEINTLFKKEKVTINYDVSE